MIKKLYESAIINTWFNGVIQLLSSLIAIPIVITKLSVAEINVWFLFTSLSAFGQTLVSGFGRTFSRFITYAYSGIKIKDFNTITTKKEAVFNKKFDPHELSSIFLQMKQINTIISCLFIVIIGGIGYFFLKSPIGEMDQEPIGWITYFIIILSGGLNLYFGLYSIFLQGIKKVNLVQKTYGLINLTGLFFILFVLFFHPTFLLIVLVYQFISLTASISIYFLAKDQMKKLEIKVLENKFDLNLFSIVWNSAWKNGLTSIISGSIKHFSALLIAQWFPPLISASFLFTKRIFDILEKFTAMTYMARLPNIAQLRSRGLHSDLNTYLRQTMILSFAVFISGYLAFITIGDFILGFIQNNVNLGSTALIILFSFSSLISRWTGIMMSVSDQSNNIIEHKNALIIFAVFFTSIMFLYKDLQLLAFPTASLIALLCTIPFIIKQVYKHIDTSFIRFERYVFLPTLALLILINSIYSAL